MTLDAKKKVREVIAAEFNGRHKGELNFDPIIVKPDVDYYGDDYYRVLVVVGGDSSLLDSAWLAGLITRVRDNLEQYGIMELVSPYLIDKAEYDHYVKRGKDDTL